MRNLLFLPFVIFIFLAACRKQAPNHNYNNSVVFSVRHQVDGSPLVLDSVIYTNAAGNHYGIQKLQYYLSNIAFYKSGKKVHLFDTAILINAFADSVCSFTLSPSVGMESGQYDSLSFTIGLDAMHNLSNALPSTLQNLDMAWPDAMGGGYHFLKLEGHYQNNLLLAGYAMHLGQTGFHVNSGLHCSLLVPDNASAHLNLIMNVNEWFTSPNTYDFNIDGVFSMGDTLLMTKLAQNGKNVFRIVD